MVISVLKMPAQAQEVQVSISIHSSHTNNSTRTNAQCDRIRDYCNMHAVKLIDIKANEGISGSTLERPGSQAALQMLKRGRANTLLVAKLDSASTDTFRALKKGRYRPSCAAASAVAYWRSGSTSAPTLSTSSNGPRPLTATIRVALRLLRNPSEFAPSKGPTRSS